MMTTARHPCVRVPLPTRTRGGLCWFRFLYLVVLPVLVLVMLVRGLEPDGSTVPAAAAVCYWIILGRSAGRPATPRSLLKKSMQSARD